MTEFLIPDMTCGGCVKAVTNAVRALDPAGTVEADLQTHRVRVTAKASDAALAASLREAGFTPQPAATPETRA
ncbi:MAG: heavy-metal-associated domain-containing protein [Rhodospirillales bacterium]|nr:heavy-metal-associated domain-containing protein [Rhodospirillales bacterium]MDE2197703.1 heavy-metal-associated domain-containing protein [Rhodospirillales bacterium]MDE2576078.1 heavy-metal-associated domain-containing protein [Rhodospirillales bacterium]